MENKIAQENWAFARRIIYGVLLGTFLLLAFIVGRPKTAADVELAKVETQAQFAVFTAAQAERERVLVSQNPRVRCAIDLRNSMPWVIVHSAQQFKELVASVCLAGAP